ncbi:MAG: hypothetical protein J7499_19680 [Sphingopyxis sp.]|nr:hypothetical protein [Sphingopyxis sp.]
METSLFRLLIPLVAAFPGFANAVACEVADVPKTLKEIDGSARQQFENADGVYEGVILSSPDDRDGGAFWVIKTHKGQGRSFQLLQLPIAGGCIGALGPSGLADTGFLTISAEPSTHFDGLIMPQTVESWARQGFVDRGRVTTAKVSAVLGGVFLVLLAGVMWRFKRRAAGMK